MNKTQEGRGRLLKGKALLLVGDSTSFVGLASLLVVALLVFVGEAGVLAEALQLGPDVLHVLGELLGGLPPALPRGHARFALGPAVAPVPPEEPVAEGDCDADGEEAAEDGEALGALLEAGREAEEDEGDKQEHDDDVHDREAAPDAGGLAELAGEVDGDASHEGDGVPDVRMEQR